MVARRPDVRCQLCGIGTTIGRFRTKDEPAGAGWPANRNAGADQDESDCNGCFVGRSQGQDDEEDAADSTYMPEENEKDPEGDKWEYLKQSKTGDGYDGEPATVASPADDADMSDNSELYTSFLEQMQDRNDEVMPLTDEYKEKDHDWASKEHIAGPDCRLTSGYSGHRITADEMHGCRTFQLLCPKPAGWTPNDQDEELEKDPSSQHYLSGLTDNFDSKHAWNNIFVPLRHGQGKHHVCNWAGHAGGDVNQAAMPFHPTCFEVFKRASLHRYGKVDVGGLMGWYRVEATWHFTDKIFPHDEAVKRAFQGKGKGSGSWKHLKGDEWIAANPLFVPGLAALDVSTDEPFVKTEHGAASAEEEVVDLANLSLSSDTANQTLSQCFEQVVEEMPWLWEAWCKLPYSGWALTTQTELDANPLDRQHEREYLQNLIDFVTENEDDSHPAPEQSQEDMEHVRQRLDALDKEEPTCPEAKEAPVISRAGTDWRKLYSFLKDHSHSFKGLRNRQRIWSNCNYIIGRIELQREKGKIAPLGSPLEKDEMAVATEYSTTMPTAACSMPHCGMSFDDDYSEPEAEFSDTDECDSEPESDEKADDDEMEIGE